MLPYKSMSSFVILLSLLQFGCGFKFRWAGKAPSSQAFVGAFAPLAENKKQEPTPPKTLKVPWSDESPTQCLSLTDPKYCVRPPQTKQVYTLTVPKTFARPLLPKPFGYNDYTFEFVHAIDFSEGRVILRRALVVEQIKTRRRYGMYIDYTLVRLEDRKKSVWKYLKSSCPRNTDLIGVEPAQDKPLAENVSQMTSGSSDKSAETQSNSKTVVAEIVKPTSIQDDFTVYFEPGNQDEVLKFIGKDDPAITLTDIIRILLLEPLITKIIQDTSDYLTKVVTFQSQDRFSFSSSQKILTESNKVVLQRNRQFSFGDVPWGCFANDNKFYPKEQIEKQKDESFL